MSTVCVHGLGYIGLPTAAMLANYDHTVFGFDTDTEVVNRLEEKDLHYDEPGLRAFVTQALESDRLTVVDDVVEAKYHIICVPTPFDEETRTPDLAYVEAVGRSIAPQLRLGDTVILESTVPPGTTVGLLQPILEGSGLKAGDDFALVHCPETVLPSNIITELRQNNRIIGGVNGVSTEAAVRLYDSFVEAEIRSVANATLAEFVKLIQNTFRDTNIALANEIAKVANDHSVDSREAIELANQHPRVNIHHPGPGVGGHCIPVDPWFLGEGSDELDLIETARRINDTMSGYVIDRLIDELGSLEGAKVAILGVAYKGNVGDIRKSPGLQLGRELQEIETENPGEAAVDGGSEITVAFHDPHVTDQSLRLQSLEEALRDADGVIVTTDHKEFSRLDPETVERYASDAVVIDSKGVLDRHRWEASELPFSRI